MITSKRTFGVELEMGQLPDQNESILQAKFTKLNNKAQELGWDIGNDISIKKLSMPVEARSPILCGREGEKNFREFTDYVQKLGYQVNETCGTHIHLGGSDFVNRTHLKEVSLEEYVANLHEQGYNAGLAFDVDAYKTIVDNTIEEYIPEVIIQANNNHHLELSIPISNNRISKMVCADMVIGELGMRVKIIIKASKLRKILGEEYSHATITLGKDIDIEEVIFMSRPIKENYVKLKRLFMFYTVFDSVLFRMLAKTRQINNRFCKPLSVSYPFDSIQRVSSMGEIEKLWYGSSKIEELVAMKQEAKHESRRHSVNLHSLLGGIGTIEVRMHHGSLDSEELVKWIELHQYIIDQISAENIDVESVKAAASVQDLETKILLMVQSIGIPKHLELYIMEQIKK